MQEIVENYPPNTTEYLLPIITKCSVNLDKHYRNKGYSINRNLKIISELLGLAAPLTLYVARHSWASIAKSKGIPLSVISQGMGHDSESTTQIYLASLETSVIDKANRMIIRSLL